MNSPAFLKDIKQEVIVYSIGADGKKNLNARNCIGKGYSMEQAEVLKQDGDLVGIMYYIKDSQYVVVDIDSRDYTPDNLFDDSGIDSVTVAGNTKGHHVWMMLKDEKIDEFKRNKVDCGIHTTIDFLGEKVFERIDKEWTGEEPQYLTDDQIAQTFKPKTFVKRLKPASDAVSSPVDLELLKKIVNLINIKYCDNREDWVKIVLAMRKCGMPFSFADEWSQCSSRYSQSGVEGVWNSYTSTDLITVGQGTLRYYAKESDKEAYFILCPSENYFIKTIDLTKGAMTTAVAISGKLDKHLKWSNEKWWMFYDKTNLWVETKEPSHLIVQMIHKHLDFSLKKKTEERAKCDPEEEAEKIKMLIAEIEIYGKMYSFVDKPGYYSMITKHLKTILFDSEFYLKLDNNAYKVAFLNGIFDMKTGEFTEGYKDVDYITKTIPFNYERPSKKQLTFVSQVIHKICNCNDSHMAYYLGVLGQAMLGDAELEKAMYFCVGHGGNNGKTLILDALSEIMPNYVSKIHRSTFEKGYSKAHKHIASTKGKRICYVEELSHKEQDVEMLKEVADGKSIRNEILFGTDEVINIMFKLIFLSNNQPNLRVDGGIENRFRQLSHYSRFNKDTTVDNYEQLDFIQDKSLADLLKGEYKHALIKLILDAGHAYTKTTKLIIPDEFQEAASNALEANDEVKSWFNENCELGADFKCSKKEIESALSKPLREIQGEILRITNLKYVKDLKIGKSRGGWRGFRICPLNDDEDEIGCQINI